MTGVYLFAGDSITEGTLGESYVERVAKMLYQERGGLSGEVVNAGRGSDTVESLLERIEGLLVRHSPQWVILAIGLNDVWLPWLSSHSLGWRVWNAYRRSARGQAPSVDLDQFAANYRALIDTARAVTQADILVCTVPPIGEKLASPLNRRLARLNGIIKHVAADRQVPVADIWQASVEEIATLSRPSRYVPGEWLFTLIDRQRLRNTAPDDLGRRRRLWLTFDGLHLNSRGADLWANTVVTALAQAAATAAAPSLTPAQQLGLICFDKNPLLVCCTPGWEVRSHSLGSMLGETYGILADITAVRPKVQLAVLNEVHWLQVAGALPYPAPQAWWDGVAGTLYVPEAYPRQYLQDVCLPETLAGWHAWPPALADTGEPARATAVADLLAIEELSRLFLRQLGALPPDPALDQFLVSYLAQIVLGARTGEGAGEILALWDSWTDVLARAGVAQGQVRRQAREFYRAHGDELARSLPTRVPLLEGQIQVSPLSMAPESTA
jgi:lysophospholipase L1-like esterase